MFVQTFTTAPGTEINSASVPAGEIAAVSIDNPTGGWIFLPSLREYIPPYTLGWVRLLDVMQASFTMQWAAIGPDGTASIMLGDPAKLVLYDAQAAQGIASYPGRQFTPIPRKQQFVTAGVGFDLGVTRFTGVNVGRLIAGVIIDNPSGSWMTLTVDGVAWRIPPYTLRWVKRIDPPNIQVDSFTYDATGPAGQVSTTQGDAATLTIQDLPPDAADTAFVEGFTPVLVAPILIAVPQSTGIAAGTTILFPAVGNKRYRILTCDVTIAGFTASPPSGTPYDVGVQFMIQTTGGQGFVVGRVSGSHPESSRNFPNGLDCPIGEGIELTANVDWPADASLVVILTAQLL